MRAISVLLVMIESQVAWCKCIGDAKLPERVHMPCWFKSCVQGMEIKHLHVHNFQLIEHLSELLQKRQDQQSGQKRGGWMPKMATLIKAVKAQDWDQVDWLVKSYVTSSRMLKELVDTP